MSDPETEARISALETRLEKIEAALSDLRGESPPRSPYAPKPTGEPANPPPLPVAQSAESRTEEPPAFPARTPETATTPPPPPEQPTPSASGDRLASSGEAWLARLGILLLIAGLAFFLKLSFDRGWISPPVRLVLSSLAAVGLLFAGEFNRAKRVGLAHAMIGGGIAFAFGTVFAAYFLYGYLSPVPAFMITVAIAAGCFWQSIRCDSSVLATLGAIGGFAAPILLAAPSVPIWSIGAQTAVVFAACAAIHAVRGWRWFFAISMSLAVVTLLIGAASLRPAGQAFWDFLGGNLSDAASRFNEGVRTPDSGGWLQGSIIFVTLAACAGTAWRKLCGRDGSLAEFTALAMPFALLFVTDTLWNFPSNKYLGIFSISLAAVWGASAFALFHWKPEARLAGAYAATAAGLAALAPALYFETRIALVLVVVVGFAFCLGTETRRSVLEWTILALISAYVALAVLVLGVTLLDQRSENWIGPFVSGVIGACYFIATANIVRNPYWPALARLAGYGLLCFVSLAAVASLEATGPASAAAIITIALGSRFIEGRAEQPGSEIITNLLFAGGTLLILLGVGLGDPPRLPFLNLNGFLLTYSAAGLAAAGWWSMLWKVYLPVSAAAFAVVIWHEFFAFQSGQWVSILWALMAATMVTAGVRQKSGYVIGNGFILLAITLARLVFVDLDALDPVGKAAVFAGVGALLLAAGVLLPKFMRRESETN